MPEWDFIIASDTVSSIVSLVNGTWVATAGGLWVYREVDQGFSFRAVRSDLSITSMALDPSDKEIWLSSAGGVLWRYEMENGTWEPVVKFPIQDDKADITAILPLNRSVYVGVGSCGFTVKPTSLVKGGVGVYDARGRQWRWLEGIQIRDVKSLAVFEGYLWVGGAEGVQARAIRVG
jgi:ligand-binding sensor domain-containing protein